MDSIATVTPELLEEVTRPLVEELHHEHIYLFGSQAWVIPHRDSVLDLLTVDNEIEVSRRDMQLRAHDVLSELGVSKEVLVRARSEVDRLSTVFASLEREVVERGLRLYAGGGPRL